MRRIGFVLFAAVLLLTGCSEKKSAGTAPPHTPPAAVAPMQTIARIHWIGMDRISRQTNAASVMTVWNFPETRTLEQQTLDKLSLAPWRLLDRHLDTNTARLFQPLLNDIVSNESCLEIRQATNMPDAMVFAIRLDDQRADLWQTNLERVLESLTGIQPVPSPGNQYGWSLKKHHEPDFLELARAGDWTLFSASQSNSSFLAEIKSRIQKNQSPVAVEDGNNWLEADLDPARLSSAFSLAACIAGGEGRGEAGSNCVLSPDHIHLAVIGERSNVLTHISADFPKPLDLPLSAWEIPTNYIHGPLTSFSALRGLAPFLADCPAWQKLEMTSSPDQAYIWSQVGGPFQTYFAAPLPDASNQIQRLAGRLVKNGNPWMATNGQGNFQWIANPARLVWNDAFIISPYLVPVTVNQHDYAIGGLYSLAGGPNCPPDILRTVLDTTNLVYYHFEQTGSRVEDYLFITQLFRVVFHKAQLSAGSTATVWLKKVEPLLGPSTALVNESGPAQLILTRTSTVGFTAIELHLLADWLESPEFPIGLHTFIAPPPKQ